MDKRDLGLLFRERLGEVMARHGGSNASFAESIDLDRSALSQIMSPGAKRLPRAETLQRIAEMHHVSLDWLLGLTQSDQLASVIAPTLAIEELRPGETDTELARWHEEARGTKIRYVPATIPDLLRTEAVIGYEHVQGAARVATRIKEAGRQLSSSRRTETDMEVCLPLQRLQLLAEGRGIWSGLEVQDRAEQLAVMARLTEELYPSFRLYLYDDLTCFSAPYTVFGTMRAAIYVGQMYLVVSSVEHIRGLTRHFDDLVRKAAVNAHETAAWIGRLTVS